MTTLWMWLGVLLYLLVGAVMLTAMEMPAPADMKHHLLEEDGGTYDGLPDGVVNVIVMIVWLLMLTGWPAAIGWGVWQLWKEKRDA